MKKWVLGVRMLGAPLLIAGVVILAVSLAFFGCRYSLYGVGCLALGVMILVTTRSRW